MKSFAGYFICLCGVAIIAGCGYMYLQRPETAMGCGLIAFFIGGGVVMAGIGKMR